MSDPLRILHVQEKYRQRQKKKKMQDRKSLSIFVVLWKIPIFQKFSSDQSVDSVALKCVFILLYLYMSKFKRENREYFILYQWSELKVLFERPKEKLGKFIIKM